MNEPVLGERPSAFLDVGNPWPGLAAFGEAESEYFLGRGDEALELAAMVAQERVTILYGRSGLGKTSLLCAGLFPMLRQAEILPVYIRLSLRGEGAFDRAQILDAVARTATAAGIEMPSNFGGDTLWEIFYRRDAAFWDRANRLVTPLLVFDQFEEIFTAEHARTSERRELLEELVSLADGRPVPAVAERLETSLEDYSQFSFSRHACKILLSLREDFLAELESVGDSFRNTRNNRFRLRPMSGQRALEVVARTSGHFVQQDIAEDIVRSVAGAGSDSAMADLELEPALLSILCRELNEERKARVLPMITRDLVALSSSEILRDFYEASVSRVGRASRRFIEEQLVNTSGFRHAVPLETALDTPEVTRQDLDYLMHRRVLRVSRSGPIEVIELTHDRLAELVRASRQQRSQTNAAARLEAAGRAARDPSVKRLVLWNRILVTTVIFLLALVALLLARA